MIEDAAQAFGSTWNGKRIGAFGDFVSFSFHANKNITTIEGGCLVLNNADEARLAREIPAAGRHAQRRGRHRRRRARRQVQPDRRRRARSASASCSTSNASRRTAHALARALLRALRARFEALRRAAAGRRTSSISNWHMFQIVLPLESRARAPTSCAHAEGTRHRHRRATMRRSTCSRCTASAASRKACSRIAEQIGRLDRHAAAVPRDDRSADVERAVARSRNRCWRNERRRCAR